MDGLGGPMLSGTCYYIKRKALYGYNLEEKGKVHTQIWYKDIVHIMFLISSKRSVIYKFVSYE